MGRDGPGGRMRQGGGVRQGGRGELGPLLEEFIREEVGVRGCGCRRAGLGGGWWVLLT